MLDTNRIKSEFHWPPNPHNPRHHKEKIKTLKPANNMPSQGLDYLHQDKACCLKRDKTIYLMISDLFVLDRCRGLGGVVK